MSIFNKIQNMIRQAFYKEVDPDTSFYPVGLASANSKQTKFVRLSTYGLCANPTKDSHVLFFGSQGQESVKFGIINDFLNRKKGLKEGEACLYNAMTGTAVYLKEDGEIDILDAAAINFIGDLNIEGNLNITGDIVITGDINITGNIESDGDINSTGTITADTDVVADGVSLKTHTHGGIEPGAGNTGAPN